MNTYMHVSVQGCLYHCTVHTCFLWFVRPTCKWNNKTTLSVKFSARNGNWCSRYFVFFFIPSSALKLNITVNYWSLITHHKDRHFHTHNLANNVEGAKLTMGIRNFILQRSQIWKRWNWSHKSEDFRFLFRCIFYLPLFNSPTTEIFLVWKNMPPTPEVTPMDILLTLVGRSRTIFDSVITDKEIQLPTKNFSTRWLRQHGNTVPYIRERNERPSDLLNVYDKKECLNKHMSNVNYLTYEPWCSIQRHNTFDPSSVIWRFDPYYSQSNPYVICGMQGCQWSRK
jgi:hypothetical protein